MLGLPKTTEFNKRIPKQKFYENLDISPSVKKAFVEQIKVIYWRNKIAATTTNLAEGKQVKELEVFEIKLQKPEIDLSILKQIDREIPYHLLFILEYDGKHQAWIGYKEATHSGPKAFKVEDYYHTAWTDGELLLKIEGFSVDSVYEGFVRQIAGTSLGSAFSEENLKVSVEKAKQKKTIQKQIEELECRARKEMQSKKKYELFQKIKQYQKKLEDINNG